MMDAALYSPSSSPPCRLLGGSGSASSITQRQQQELFGTFLKVAKNCLALSPGLMKGMREDSSLLQSQCSLGRSSLSKRVRKRHPATIQTPGRRIPTEAESAVEPLTSNIQSLDVFDEDLDDHPYSRRSSSSHTYHHPHEEELMILGEWEFDEEGFHGQSNEEEEEPLLEENEPWFVAEGQRRSLSTEKELYGDDDSYPRKKLSNSLSGPSGGSDFPVLTLYS